MHFTIALATVKPHKQRLYGYYMFLHSGGPDGEINASLRYLSQRFTMPNRVAMGVLNDIGTEESVHGG